MENKLILLVRHGFKLHKKVSLCNIVYTPPHQRYFPYDIASAHQENTHALVEKF
jgi:hypothetical protein